MILRSRALPWAGLFLAAGLVFSGFSRSAPLDRQSFGFSSGENGARRLIRRAEDGGWNLLEFLPGNPASHKESALVVEDDLLALSLFEDSLGRPWMAGEIAVSGGSLIRIGRLANGTFVDSRLIGFPSGWNEQADLCFPEPNRPWIAWRHQAGPAEEIWVQDITGGRKWRISAAGAAALSAPKLRSDGRGGLWALWAGREGSEYVLAGRHYDGRSFSEIVRIAANGDRPIVQPDALCGQDGILRLVWSAYDGRDYELFIAENGAGDWSRSRPLTNDPATDSLPRLVDMGSSGTAVVWDHSGVEGSRIRASLLLPGAPVAPVAVSNQIEPTDLKVIGSEDRLTLMSFDKGVLQIDFLPLADLLSAPQAETAAAASEVAGGKNAPAALNLTVRDNTKYVAFGDSITYGDYNDQDRPDLGYPPRLDILLDAAFGPTTVINAGVPGEFTDAALARIDAVLAANTARWFLIMEGTNDVKNTNYTIDSALFNLREVCKRCLNAGVLPILATVIPRRDSIWYDQKFVNRHNALEAGIKQAAVDLRIPLMDMENVFNSYPGGPEALLQPYPDGKHPNLLGYQVMAEAWAKAAKALPFPPGNFRIMKKTPSAGAPRPIPMTYLQDNPGYGRVLAAGGSGFLLTWQPDPKTADISAITGYRIYRKKRGESASSFVLVGSVPAIFAFFDRTIAAGSEYDYVVATLGANQAEGPCSAVVSSY